MIRVLTLAPNVYDGTSFYRLGGVMPYLDKQYDDVHIKDLSHTKEVDWADYAGYDVAVFQRPFIKPHLTTLNMLKLMGVRVIVDYDDDILNLPIHNPYYHNYKNNEDNIRLIMAAADHVWVSTPDLKEEVSKYNKSVEIVPNAHNDYLFPVKNKKTFDLSTKKVSYRGGSTHEVDVYSHIDDWVNIINNNLDYEFFFIGSRFPYMESKCGDNYVIMPGTHILDYFRNFHMLNPNIFIYPLENNKFNKGKSNISWIEATYSGAAVLAPSFHQDFKKPGIMNFDESFSDLFYSIKDNPKKLKKMNEESWDYIKENLLLSYVNQQRYNSLYDVKNRK